MGVRSSEYCNKHNFAYNRYADDLVFFLMTVNPSSFIQYGKEDCGDEDFHLNNEKTHFAGLYAHQEVLGIILNDELTTAPRKMKREVRFMI